MLDAPADDPGIFATMSTMRAMRRLRPDPVPMDLVRRVIEAGTWAPSGQNTQPWAFVVVTDRETKQFVQQRYHAALVERLGPVLPKPDDHSATARSFRAAVHLAEHLNEAPVLLFVCGRRDWPFVIPADQRVGKAPPSYGSIYPCVENVLLACRALGLGASLTTLHALFEDALCASLEIPAEYGVVAMIPIGYPLGRFGPVRRRPQADVTYYGRWGRSTESVTDSFPSCD
jgi:nitroreductase